MKKFKTDSGITMIALILTIIIIIALSVIALNIFRQHVDNYVVVTEDVKYQVSISKEKETIILAYEVAVFKKSIAEDTLIITADDLSKELPDAEVTPTTGNKIKISFNSSQRKYTIDANKQISFLGGPRNIIVGEEVAVTLADGTEEVINKDNVSEYIGDPITNYKPPTENNTEELRIGANVYTLSQVYKLYYIDFDNKYGDGKGTIYLKADYIPSQYQYETGGNIETSLIEKFNPSMYASGVEIPDINSKKMKAAIWLLDTSVWGNLLDSTIDEELADKINYVVGAPSLELMFDSYNQYYGLTGNTPVKPTGTERVKLFYKFLNKNGYVVAPNGENSNEYGQYTVKNSVRSDSVIDPMYYPGLDKAYYLATPSTKSNYSLMRVLGSKDMGGFVSYTPKETSQNCFCPIISLAPDCVLNLGS